MSKMKRFQVFCCYCGLPIVENPIYHGMVTGRDNDYRHADCYQEDLNQNLLLEPDPAGKLTEAVIAEYIENPTEADKAFVEIAVRKGFILGLKYGEAIEKKAYQDAKNSQRR